MPMKKHRVVGADTRTESVSQSLDVLACRGGAKMSEVWCHRPTDAPKLGLLVSCMVKLQGL
jgi:hydroxymethylglutaryl-CoA reductase